MTQNRKGQTEITSVSLSTEFSHILKSKGLSPTEMIRRGIAITLFEMGDPRYQTSLNKQRYEAINYFFKSGELQKSLIKIKNLIEHIESISSESGNFAGSGGSPEC
jgi:hypothetical protein